jgi:hypothetical protein
MQQSTTRITHELAEIWIAAGESDSFDYCYGGTRIVDPEMASTEVTDILQRLMVDESMLKNRLINTTFREGVLAPYKEQLPPGFIESMVGGARCVIQPHNKDSAALLKNPAHPEFQTTILSIFEPIGKFLNSCEGKIKLTPDFGRFAGLADLLAVFTPHVLGIRCEDGGCGGKSSYSSSGIIAALETLRIGDYKDDPITLIGSAGAMGIDILAYFKNQQYQDIALCDLDYNHKGISIMDDIPVLPAIAGTFTNLCLERGGCLVATTVGQELEHANISLIPTGTMLLLAHNLAIPEGESGINLMRTIAAQNILALPGQLLTLGGALTSRLEWFWRQTNHGMPFPKPLAHTVVKTVVSSLVSTVLELALKTGLSPYEAMFLYAEMS